MVYTYSLYAHPNLASIRTYGENMGSSAKRRHCNPTRIRAECYVLDRSRGLAPVQGVEVMHGGVAGARGMWGDLVEVKIVSVLVAS